MDIELFSWMTTKLIKRIEIIISRRVIKKMCQSISLQQLSNTLLKIPNSQKSMSTKVNRQRSLKLSQMLITKKGQRQIHTQSLNSLSKMFWKRDSLSIKSLNQKKNPSQLQNSIMFVRAMVKFQSTFSVSINREQNQKFSGNMKRSKVNALMALAGWKKVSAKKCSLSLRPPSIGWRKISAKCHSQ